MKGAPADYNDASQSTAKKVSAPLLGGDAG